MQFSYPSSTSCSLKATHSLHHLLRKCILKILNLILRLFSPYPPPMSMPDSYSPSVHNGQPTYQGAHLFHGHEENWYQQQPEMHYSNLSNTTE